METVVDRAAEQRFESLVGAVVEPVRRYLVRRAPAGLVDDVVGDVLLVLWRRREDAPRDDPLPWTYGVARRCLANAERGVRRQQRVAGKVASIDPPRAVPGPEPASDPELTAALAALRPEERWWFAGWLESRNSERVMRGAALLLSGGPAVAVSPGLPAPKRPQAALPLFDAPPALKR